MASIHKEALIAAPAEDVWAALRDVGNAHRLLRGVLADARLEGDSRIVVFVDGTAVRERIVTVDDERRRVAYAVLRDGVVHHNASMQVFADGADSSRFVWISDFLPDVLAASFGPLIEQGTAAAKRTLEGPSRRRHA
jgi:carbon monoxide dehydrogenase subunit G